MLWLQIKDLTHKSKLNLRSEICVNVQTLNNKYETFSSEIVYTKA